MDDQEIKEVPKETEEKSMDRFDVMISGVTSYKEVDAMEKAQEAAEEIEEDVRIFPELARNIMSDHDTVNVVQKITNLGSEFVERVKMHFSSTEEKAAKTKTEGGVAYPASDFAYVPDQNTPSTWKLRLAEGRPGNITVAQLGRAAAAFSPGGFRGNKVDIPSGDVSKVKRRIRSEYKKLNAEVPASVKERNGMTVYKDDSDGLYKFICCYSNNFRDDDTPAEIISAKSHKNFVEKVEKGQADYPVVQIWHEDAWTIGKATWVATDEHEDGSCFALAAGYFFKGMEPVAEALMEVEDLRMSHGMPVVSIKRNADDQTIIDEHISKEITVLPGGAEANRWTYFNPIMEDKKEMTIPQAKREAVQEKFGLDANVLDTIESQNEATAAKNIEDQVELKDKEEPAEEPTEEIVETPTEETKELPITREEIVEGFQTLAAQIMKGVEEKIGELKKEQKTEEEVIKETIQNAPMFSISSMLRASQSDDTKMKQAERTNGPVETKETGSSVAEIISKGGGLVDVLKSVTQSQE